MLSIKRTTSEDSNFQKLVRLLDIDLQIRDGDLHQYYAVLNKTDGMKTVVVAYEADQPVGCGAIRAFNNGNDAVEVKRMFVLPEKRQQGIAATVLSALEQWAKELNFNKCVLETGKNQPEALAFYKKNGYLVIPNFGKYIGVENSVCFEKNI